MQRHPELNREPQTTEVDEVAGESVPSQLVEVLLRSSLHHAGNQAAHRLQFLPIPIPRQVVQLHGVH